MRVTTHVTHGEQQRRAATASGEQTTTTTTTAAQQQQTQTQTQTQMHSETMQTNCERTVNELVRSHWLRMHSIVAVPRGKMTRQDDPLCVHSTQPVLGNFRKFPSSSYVECTQAGKQNIRGFKSLNLLRLRDMMAIHKQSLPSTKNVPLQQQTGWRSNVGTLVPITSFHKQCRLLQQQTGQAGKC
jgi:hypothetical protein